MVATLNPYLPSAVQDAYIPDRLIAGDKKLVTATGMIAAGAVYYRGSVLGRSTTGTVTGTLATGGTGNGTITGVAAGQTSLPGTYTLTATSATNFTVVDPQGATRAPATVGTPYASNVIGFTINAGSTPFAAGDHFTIVSTAPTGEYLLAVSTATDGSQNPTAILVDNVDTTAGATTAGIYLEGEFNANSLAFGAGFDAANVATALRSVGIQIKYPVSGSPTVYS